MRATRTSGNLRVHAVAGTYVVSFGFHMPKAACDGLLGFSVHRTDHTADEAAWITGTKVFEETDPGFPAEGARYSTFEHPVQSFQWADYTAKPGHRYTYRVLARKGTPRALVTSDEVRIPITTESPDNGDHDVYFNRGISASQEYVRRFGDQRPSSSADVATDPIYVWLSRGLYEALVAYIEACVPGRDALRIAAYEFAFAPLLDVIRRAVDRGVDVRISYDGREKGESGSPGKPNRAAVQAAGLAHVCTERTQPKSAISHNKFIVKLTDGVPVSVWTGGTNFSRSGIFGHSNVAHVIEEPAVAAQFLQYWQALDADPAKAALSAKVEALTPFPALPVPKGTTAIFSPRGSEEALEAYARIAKSAKDGLMMTFAFGINDVFKDVYRTATAPFRLALLEKATRPMGDGPEKDAELAAIRALRNMPENVFAIGSLIATNKLDGWVKEQLSDLSKNVQYVHNKFMLVDPLGRDPIVVAGSANFSKASTVTNDENMLIIRGNTRVADIYLGEFMRLWNHHAFRETRRFAGASATPRFLKLDDWWADSFGQTPRAARRRFFARVSGD